MKSYLFLVALLITAKSFSQQPYQLLSYAIYVNDKRIINEAVIDMQLANEVFLSYPLRIKSIKTKSVNETIIAQIPISRKNIPNIYNELTISFKNNFAVIFRAYNDGFAYRIATSFKDSITVINETAQFNFANDAHAWAPIITKRPDQDVFHTSFEE